jgi:thymidylate synthase
MTEVFRARDSLEAWVAAAAHLCQVRGAEDSNLVLDVARPDVWEGWWFDQIDPRRVSLKGERPSDVANTIFPLRTWLNSRTRDEFYARYLEAHARGHRKRWGTYFLRLINFGTRHVNQLENAIRVLNEWKNEPGTAIVFHLSSPEYDSFRPLGAPCLQLVQLHVHHGTVSMVAFYRNHDYFNKALPNLVGLGQLLNFICYCSGRRVGNLVCHSSHAFTSGGVSGLNHLLERS